MVECVLLSMNVLVISNGIDPTSNCQRDSDVDTIREIFQTWEHHANER